MENTKEATMSDYITLDLTSTMKKYSIPEEAWECASETLLKAEDFIYDITFGILSM